MTARTTVVQEQRGRGTREASFSGGLTYFHPASALYHFHLLPLSPRHGSVGRVTTNKARALMTSHVRRACL